MELSRRDVMTQGALAGVALVAAPALPAWAAASPAALQPVAFVWMGQVMLDPSGRQDAYRPPMAHRRSPIDVQPRPR